MGIIKPDLDKVNNTINPEVVNKAVQILEKRILYLENAVHGTGAKSDKLKVLGLEESLNGLSFKKYDSGEFSATMSGSGDKWTKTHGLGAVPSFVTVWGQFSGESYWIQLLCQPLNSSPLKAHTGHSGGDPSSSPQGCSSVKATSTSITFNNDQSPSGSLLVGSKGIDDINKCRVIALLF
ncbi:MAG: hypothetical protein Tp1124DCM412261_38 [Prokaryotic dsDNA virus sp.]|nr:MAG: hypothetical protein Tp1124DCM412261_38 [Prokaryotic dsDNA virus sp.]|tara:strand:- start:250 stop:789 length:540 start_codon:yes stop_codon:yes gene_type:complete